MDIFIRNAVSKLRLDDAVCRKALNIYQESSNHPDLTPTRIKDENLAIASVYIANRLVSDHPLEQNIFIYKFNISFATLRKCYIRICDALKIDRDMIVSEHHLKHS